MATKLQLKLSDYQYVTVGRFGSSKRDIHKFQTADLSLPLKDGSVLEISVHVIYVITSKVQKLPLDVTKHPALQFLPLSDSLCAEAEMVSIDVLIGGDYLHQIFTGERIDVGDGLFLYGSKLGYVAAGTVPAIANTIEHTAIVLFAPTYQVNCPQFQLEKFWSLEDIGIRDDPYIADNDRAQEVFDQTVSKRDGRYQVGLPWRYENVELPDNFGLAIGRLKSLQNRLKGHPDTLKQYSQILEDQIKAGVVEKVRDKDPATKLHYIPHHCVVRPDSATTKLRVVYDASAKAGKGSPSLNECLLRGPVVVQDLCGFLLRFRISSVVLLGDIEKAFHQIGIQPSDRDALRFLWLKDPCKPVSRENLVVLRFCRVPFGMVCSSFLLDASIKHHLACMGTDMASRILKDIYVDNIQGGGDSSDHALRFYNQAKSCFAGIHMNLREWYSNSEEFLSSIPEEDKGRSTKPKVLGLPWETSSDVLSCIGPPLSSPCLTKRQLLAFISAIFDPCGWVAPVVVRAKLLMQDLWKANCAWDKPMPDQLARQAADMQKDLVHVSNIALPRQINVYISNSQARHELHCFVDASGKAYAAVVYVRSLVPTGKASTGLAFAKARLAPIKTLKIPRLELMATVVGVRLLRFVETELKPRITFASKFLWSDSTCVLHWLQSNRQLKVFVQNRISEVKKAAGVQFRHVPSMYNPADLPSRGLIVDDLKGSELWWQGPKFLLLTPDMWPENISQTLPPPEASDEFAKGPMVTLVEQTLYEPKEGIGNLIDPKAYSTWKRLLRVTGFVLMAVNTFKDKLVAARTARIHVGGRSTPITLQPIYLLQAETHWMRAAQAEGGITQVNASKSMEALGPHMDEIGILRCSGRLGNSSLDEEAIKPILLPKDHPITTLIIQACHEALAHAGVRQTLAQFRFRFWVPHGRRQVKKAIARCTHCRRVRGGPFRAPQFPPIPQVRVTPTLAFDKVGIDYLGPLLVKAPDRPEGCSKVWVVLFTCCVTRAVYLDLVTELSAEQFLLCFRRFSATFVVPSLIISDNAKQFKTVDNTFRKAAQDWADGSAIEWKFITETAPWMGGFYERLVGTVKSALRKTLWQRRLSRDQLQTVLFEVAKIVNSRPLVSTDYEQQPGEVALTPGHFLCKFSNAGRSCFSQYDTYVPKATRTTSETLLDNWKAGQRLLDDYWKCWKNEYLASLRERTAVRFRQRNCAAEVPKAGTVVQIKEDSPRHMWRLGVIQNTRQGQYGLCRAADVRLATGKVLTRPIKDLYPIEQSLVDTEFAISEGDNHQADQPQSPNRASGMSTQTTASSQHSDQSQARRAIQNNACSRPSNSAARPKRPSRRAAQIARDGALATIVTESDDEQL